MPEKPKVRTCLWFESEGAKAAEFYVSLLPNSRIDTYLERDADKPPLIVELSLAGTPYMFLNGGPNFKLSPAASIEVRTEDQEETDRLWEALTSDGGKESQCGWLVDKFGVSWQIVPNDLVRMLSADDREAAGRAMEAMMQMTKIQIAEIESAFRGE